MRKPKSSKRKRDFKLNKIKEMPDPVDEKKERFEKHRTEVSQYKGKSEFDALFKKIYEKKHMKKIGQGNQGIVYKIVSDDLKKYAVKETELALMPLHELHLMRQIDHPKVVKFFDFREKDNNLFMVIEYMNAGTLKEMIAIEDRIEEDYLKLFVFQILEGLSFLHGNLKIFHRDIKPANLLFNIKGQIKLADFGVSAQVVRTLQMKDTYVGTEKYMSPERLQGPKHGSLSDIWSLGIIVYECYYGHHPVKYENQLDLINKMKNFSVPKDAPKHLSDFIQTCLQFEPHNRQSAKELLEHPWLDLARKIHADGKIETFCKKFIVKHWKKRMVQEANHRK